MLPLNWRSGDLLSVTKPHRGYNQKPVSPGGKEKIMRTGLIKVCGVLFMLFLCMNNSSKESKEVIQENLIKEPIEIVETVPLPTPTPDIVELLKEEIHETRHWDERCSDSTLQIDQEDAVRLMKLSTAEAATEGVQGQLYIMEVAMNRVRSEDFPNTVQEVIEQKDLVNGKWRYQFCTYRTGVYQVTEPDVNAHIALAMLESNKDLNNDIIAFEVADNGYLLNQWFDIAFQYHNHIFYKKRQ